MNRIISIPLTAIVIATSLTLFSCSSDSGGDGNKDDDGNVVGGVSSSGGDNGGDKPSGNSKTVAVKFNFRNAATNAPVQSTSLNRALARSVTGPGGATYEVDEESFSKYTWFYNEWLGGDTKEVGTGITPTKFEIPVTKLTLWGANGTIVDLIGSTFLTSNPTPKVDFAKGVTITLDNIEPDTYHYIEFWFSPAWADNYDGSSSFSTIEFNLPSEIDETERNNYSFLLRPQPAGGGLPATTHTTSGGVTKVSAPLYWLLPYVIEPFTSGGGGGDDDITMKPSLTDFRSIVFNDNYLGNFDGKYKLYPQGEFDNNGMPLIYVPMKPIVIPEGATSVTFEIRWDLNNIIQQYTGRNYLRTENNKPVWGVTDVPNDGDDIFVLKNKFWEGFSITTKVE